MDKITFQKLADPKKPELMYSSSISLKYVINAAALVNKEYPHTTSTRQETQSNIYNNKSLLYNAAQTLRKCIKSESKNILIQSVNVEELSSRQAKTNLPTELYRFLSILISNQDPEDPEVERTSSDERRILAIAQDKILCMPQHMARLRPQSTLVWQCLYVI